MSDFDPGEGWLPATAEEVNRSKTDALIFSGLVEKRYWVRKPPVPLLPTEPRTSIKVTYRAQPAELRERAQEDWVLRDNPLQWMSDHAEYRDANSLLKLITGFEVLAIPYASHLREMRESQVAWIYVAEKRVRRETAEAVLDRIATESWAREIDLRKWRAEFGVADDE